MIYILLPSIYTYMMVTLIEIAVENRLKWIVTLIEIAVEKRLKWIVILLLYHKIIFMFLDFVQLNSQCSPFLLSQYSRRCMPPLPVALQCLWGYMPPPPPFNALDACFPLPFNALEDACFPLPFNALEDACPPTSLQCSWGCMPPFKALDSCLPPPFLSDSETRLTTCCKNHFLLIQFWIRMRYSVPVLSISIS